MPTEICPQSLDELAAALRDCGSRKQSVELGGNFSKRRMGGEVSPAEVVLSTQRLAKVLAYEPKDLTISVEAGMTYRALSETVRQNGQRLPLDPPFGEQATIGGVVATNGSGPRRRRYGTARDMMIGMQMATIEGKVVQSGGMVVKNVTGLDMAKLLIGSFGTLAAITSVNFRVFPEPEQERTFVCAAPSLDTMLRLRREILGSPLQPSAIDLLNQEALDVLGLDLPRACLLVLEAGGNRAAVERYENEYGKFAREAGVSDFVSLTGPQAEAVWHRIQNFGREALANNGQVSILRVSATPSRLAAVFGTAASKEGSPAIVARAGAAVCYVCCGSTEAARSCLERLRGADLRVVVESSPPEAKKEMELWDEPGSSFEVMKRIKQSLDPDGLLNRGRLFGRL